MGHNGFGDRILFSYCTPHVSDVPSIRFFTILIVPALGRRVHETAVGKTHVFAYDRRRCIAFVLLRVNNRHPLLKRRVRILRASDDAKNVLLHVSLETRAYIRIRRTLPERTNDRKSSTSPLPVLGKR